MYSESEYGRVRRLLREHRQKMVVMDDVISDHGLRPLLENRMVEYTGNSNFWLGFQPGMDDATFTDPLGEARETIRGLRAELAERSTLVGSFPEKAPPPWAPHPP